MQLGHMQIDLNSDLGEHYGAWRMGDDDAMLAIVTSANVACGFHAGDPVSVLATVRAAAKLRVAVGAHIAYPDLVGFGRRPMTPSAAELEADVIYQIGALQALARVAGTEVSYVKPHGALYNTIAFDEQQAAAVIGAVEAVDPRSRARVWPPHRSSTRSGQPVCGPYRRRSPTGPTSRTARWCPGAGRRRARGSGPHRRTHAHPRPRRCGGGPRRQRGGDRGRFDLRPRRQPGAVHIATVVRDRLTEAGVTLRPFAADPDQSRPRDLSIR